MASFQDLTVSFAALVKSNNGAFKSAKQAAFLLGQAEAVMGGRFWISSTRYYNSPVEVTYYLDETGVTHTVKRTNSKGDVTTWTRKDNAVFEADKAAKHEKALAQLVADVARFDAYISKGFDSLEAAIAAIESAEKAENATMELLRTRPVFTPEILAQLEVWGCALDLVPDWKERKMTIDARRDQIERFAKAGIHLPE